MDNVLVKDSPKSETTSIKYVCYDCKKRDELVNAEKCASRSLCEAKYLTARSRRENQGECAKFEAEKIYLLGPATKDFIWQITVQFCRLSLFFEKIFPIFT